MSLSSKHICAWEATTRSLARSCNSAFWPVSGGRFKNTYGLLNLRALKFSPVNKIYIFQCIGKIFYVEFQRYPLKFHTKYLTHTLKDMIFIQHWNLRALRFKSSYAFLKCPRPPSGLSLASQNAVPHWVVVSYTCLWYISHIPKTIIGPIIHGESKSWATPTMWVKFILVDKSTAFSHTQGDSCDRGFS